MLGATLQSFETFPVQSDFYLVNFRACFDFQINSSPNIQIATPTLYARATYITMLTFNRHSPMSLLVTI